MEGSHEIQGRCRPGRCRKLRACNEQRPGAQPARAPCLLGGCLLLTAAALRRLVGGGAGSRDGGGSCRVGLGGGWVAAPSQHGRRSSLPPRWDAEGLGWRRRRLLSSCRQLSREGRGAGSAGCAGGCRRRGHALCPGAANGSSLSGLCTGCSRCRSAGSPAAGSIMCCAVGCRRGHCQRQAAGPGSGGGSGAAWRGVRGGCGGQAGPLDALHLGIGAGADSGTGVDMTIWHAASLQGARQGVIRRGVSMNASLQGVCTTKARLHATGWGRTAAAVQPADRQASCGQPGHAATHQCCHPSPPTHSTRTPRQPTWPSRRRSCSACSRGTICSFRLVPRPAARQPGSHHCRAATSHGPAAGASSAAGTTRLQGLAGLAGAHAASPAASCAA